MTIAAGCTAAALAIGCGGDGGPSCTQSLESACRDGSCNDWLKFDEVVNDPPLGLVVSTRCDRRALTIYGGFVYCSHARGRLIGSHGASDQVDGNRPDGFFAGDTTTHDCDSCLLTGSSFFEGEACTGQIAEPRIAMCMHDPPAFVRDCSACACTHCDPQLLLCANLAQDETADRRQARGVLRSRVQRREGLRRRRRRLREAPGFRR
jgi:hypothetical protein